MLDQYRKFVIRGKSTAWYCWVPFATIACSLYCFNAFPSLYGDEYLSLAEADNVMLNPHAIGYNLQLHVWKMLGTSDTFLRSLSLLWMIVAVYCFDRWLRFEGLRGSRFVVFLMATSPFLWTYAVQVRFYSFFLASAVLAMWRFRVWRKQPTRRAACLLLLSAVLVGSAHLFGTLLLATLGLSWCWERLSRLRYALAGAGVLGCLLLFVPSFNRLLVHVVYRLTNRYAQVPPTPGRGLSLAMLAKIPFNIFFFTLGERVYPLWWWITVPAAAFVAVAFILGFYQVRRNAGLHTLVTGILLSVPALYMAFEPLAPPELQGGAPRYVIYVVPIFLLLVGLGASAWPRLRWGVGFVQAVGLLCLLWPQWSYGGIDLMDWRQHLRAVGNPTQAACIVAGGRALEPVRRYADSGSTIVSMDHASDCSAYQRIALVTNDYRLAMTRPFDKLAQSLDLNYELVDHTAIFPAEIMVYTKSLSGSATHALSRLALPEQDLHLPLETHHEHWKVPGFVRLDASQNTVELSFRPERPDTTKLWIATNYRSDQTLPRGTPVAVLRFHGVAGGSHDMILRAGIETAAWNGACDSCRPLADWTKRVHLLGMQSYRDAYRQYRAVIWGTSATVPPWPVASVEIRSLLDQGTVYFWGSYPVASL